jgi:hypothetical protein
MRGTIKADPVYPQDIPGLLAWLNQPPSQWSAVGWQNSPAWAGLIVHLIEDLAKAEAERDEAQREICNGVARRNWPSRSHFDRMRRKYAAERGWKCFDAKDEANP